MKKIELEETIDKVMKIVAGEMDLLSTNEEDLIKSLKLGRILKTYILQYNEDIEEIKGMLFDLKYPIRKIDAQENREGA